MNAIRIVREHDQQQVGAACAKCGAFFSDVGYRPQDVAAEAMVAAEECCTSAVAERRKVREEQQRRDRDAQEAKNSARRIAEAKRIQEEEYDGPLYYEPADRYFDDADELRDWFDGEEKQAPDEVWACSVSRLQIPSLEDIVERVAENSFEDAFDSLMSDSAVQALGEAIVAANAAINVREWEPDWSVRVVLAAPQGPEVSRG